MRIAAFIAAASALLMSSSALARRYEGHEIIPTIARTERTPAVRAKVDAILAGDPDTLTGPDMVSRHLGGRMAQCRPPRDCTVEVAPPAVRPVRSAGSPRIHDFRSDLAVSEQYGPDWWLPIYRRAFPTLMLAVAVQQDGWHSAAALIGC